MEAFLAIAGFVVVAAITPGPNNFIVLAAAVRGGLAAAAPAIGGVIAGSLALLMLVWAGAGAAFEAAPLLRTGLRLAGCLYLMWLGVMLIWRSGDDSGTGHNAVGLPRTAFGVAAFQLLNPKSWVMVATAVAAAADTVCFLAALVAIFSIVPLACLTLWAVTGSAIASWLNDINAKRRFDRAMGGLLFASAALLLF